MKKDTLTTSVRMPVALAREIKRLAEEEHRSFNGMIVHLLTLAFCLAYSKHTLPATVSPDSVIAGPSVHNDPIAS